MFVTLSSYERVVPPGLRAAGATHRRLLEHFGEGAFAPGRRQPGGLEGLDA